MKNMKVRKKLILSFSIVAILCMIVGSVGIFGMLKIEEADSQLYEVQTKPLPDLAKTLEYIQRLRIQLRNVALATGNVERLAPIEADILDREAKFEAYAAAYSASIVNPQARILFDEAMDAFNDEFKPVVYQSLEGARAGVNQEQLIEIIDKTGPAANLIVDNFTECMNIKVAAAEKAAHDNAVLFKEMLILIIVVLFIVILISMSLAFYISGMISKPLKLLTEFMNKAGTTGDITLSAQDVDTINKYSRLKDEVGQCIGSTSHFVRHMTDISNQLETVAGGDLTADIVLLSENDVMGVSLNKMVENLNSMFMDLSISSNQVSSGAQQVSQGAQELASASSEQAASIEELSAAITQVRGQVDDNANRSVKVLENCNTSGSLMQESMDSMGKMLEAMTSIDESSKNITRVIKVIDDIAFQTNILALNAAVEAARAGQHGKGFAVVADEVRNLAAKSAEAAKETAALIEGSSQRVNEGNRMVERTNESLKAVGLTTEETAVLIREMTKSLEMQASSVTEINQGMGQISAVVQSNSATSEESAAAAEEMSAQSVVMNEIVSRFKLKEDKHKNYNYFDSSPSVAHAEISDLAHASSKY